ncbi:MAG: extracellular solute-binding protein [Anaerolineae bacterium]|nr:extracellular solute-binding protein [Anaerolineae bacterium]
MLTKNKSWLAFLLVAALLLSITAACGTATPEPTKAPEPTATTAAAEKDEPVAEREPCGPATDGPLAGIDPRGQTVTWWHNHSGSREEGLLGMIEEYNATNECGITIDAQNQGGYNDIRDKMNAGIQSGELPGLVVGYQNDQAFYALANGLADMNAYIADQTWGLSPADREDFYASFLEQGVQPAFGGQRLGFPPNRSMEVLFYNQTWLEELGFAGPPTTPDDFEAMACAAAEANGDGTGGYILRDDASAVAAWTMAFGGSILTEDGTHYAYDGDATKQAMAMLQRMYDNGCAYFFTEGYPNPEFAARRAIFTQGSTSGIRYYTGDMEAAENTDEWGVTAIPHTTADPVQNIYGGDIMIPQTTPETELAAWLFIKWFTSPEQQAQWDNISTYFPTRRSTADFINLDEYAPQWVSALDLLPYGSYEPQLISYQGTRDAAQQAFNRIMQGGDIDDTLSGLTEEGNMLQDELMEGVDVSAAEPCAPAKYGPLAGVDPRGVTVTWWHNHSGSREEGLLGMVEDFNATNECGITIDAQNQGGYNDIRDKMNAGIQTGELPGLVVGYQNDQAFYALANGLADMDPYLYDPDWGLTKEQREDFYASFLEQGVQPAFGNQRLGFPPNRSMEVLFYNQTWLEELGFAGPPTTPDDFEAMACAAAEANGDGTGGYILRDDASAVAAWTMAFGGGILTEDGTGYAYDGEATKQAMEMLKGMYDDGCAYFFTEGYPNPEFAARRAIFTQGSTSGIRYYAGDMEAAENTDEWGVTAIPHTTADPVQNIYGGDIMIPQTTPDTQLAAWVFLKWFTSPEQQAKWDDISTYFPTRRSTADFINLDEYAPQWVSALDLLPYGSYEPQLISYQFGRDAAQKAFNEIMQGADIDETLADLNEEANTMQAELMEGVE